MVLDFLVNLVMRPEVLFFFLFSLFSFKKIIFIHFHLFVIWSGDGLAVCNWKEDYPTTILGHSS